MAARKDVTSRAKRTRPGREETIHADAVRAALQSILISAPFHNAARLQRLLEFIVEATLRGEGSQLKEYVIALGVFRRPATFEPHLDSVVRVEARRLRAKLAEYYADEGRRANIVIDVPKGSYRPVFRHADNTGVREQLRRLRPSWAMAGGVLLFLALMAASALSGLWRVERSSSRIDSVVVLPFEAQGLDAGLRHLGVGMAEMIIESLSNFKDLRVIASGMTSPAGQRPESGVEKARRLRVAAVVEGTLNQRGNSLRIHVSLARATGQYLWSGTYERPVIDAPAAHRDIAWDVVRAIRMPTAVSLDSEAGRYLALASSGAPTSPVWRSRVSRTINIAQIYSAPPISRVSRSPR